MSDVVRGFYDQNALREWERLDRPYRKLEFASTVYLVCKYFPPTGRVADIGGGPGKYTIELLRRGYRVTLIDLSEGLLQVARQKTQEAGLFPDAIHAADACDLSFLPDGHFDAALHMGPMYHLVKREQRLKALAELYRILKPGAPAIVAFINSWGLLRALLTESPEFYRDPENIRRLFAEFTQEGPQQGFTEAYFTTPPAALGQLEEAGFEIISYAGVEGFASGSLDQLTRMHAEDHGAYLNILEAVARSCESPQFRDTTEHLHVVVRKPAL
ncbi:MAG: methyltransferase domain-containing protein [Bacillota bacterium]